MVLFALNSSFPRKIETLIKNHSTNAVMYSGAVVSMDQFGPMGYPNIWLRAHGHGRRMLEIVIALIGFFIVTN